MHMVNMTKLYKVTTGNWTGLLVFELTLEGHNCTKYVPDRDFRYVLKMGSNWPTME